MGILFDSPAPDYIGLLFRWFGDNAAWSGWLALLVSIGGFSITIKQLRKTQSATEAATRAANRTIQSLRRQQRAVAVSRLQGIVRSLDDAIVAKYSAPVSFLLHDWRDEAMRLVGLVQGEPDDSHVPDVTELLTSVDTAGLAIAAVIHAPENAAEVTEEIRKIMKRVVVPISVWAANPATNTEAVDR